MHFDFLRFSVRVFKPRKDRKQSDWRGHAKIGNHFPVVMEIEGNNPVKGGENYAQDLPEHHAFGYENKRGDADKRRRQGKIVFIGRKQKGKRYDDKGRYPQPPLEFVELLERVFESVFTHNVPIIARKRKAVKRSCLISLTFYRLCGKIKA